MDDFKKPVFVTLAILVLLVVGVQLFQKGSSIEKKVSTTRGHHHNDPRLAENNKGLSENSDPGFEEFRAWLNAFRDGTLSDEGLSKGISLARERRPRMLKLIQVDPVAALGEAIGYADYAALPDELKALVEKPFTTTGDVEVVAVCDEKDHSPEYDVNIYLEDDGRLLTGPHPEWRTGLSKLDIPLQGIRLDGWAAIEPTVFEQVEGRDLEWARVNLPSGNRDMTRDFFTGEPLGPNPITAVAGGFTFLFSGESSLKALEAELKAFDSLPGKSTGSSVLFSGQPQTLPADGFPIEEIREVQMQLSIDDTTGGKTSLFIRVVFPDLSDPPVSKGELEGQINGAVSDQLAAFSYDRTSVTATVSEGVYTSSMNSGDFNYFTLWDEAVAAYQADGHPGDPFNSFDVVGIIFPHMNVGWAGWGTIGGANSKQWLNGAVSAKTILHEYGHNYGLLHANYWVFNKNNATSTNPVDSSGENEEYGDRWDVMGSGQVDRGHFHMAAKRFLGWLDEDQVETIDEPGESGIYRIHRFDHGEAAGLQGLEIKKDEGENYWVGFRRAFEFNANFHQGAYLLWERPASVGGSPSRNQGWLVDTTPETPTNRDDAGISLYRTYSDASAGVYITPIKVGGDAPNEYLDVVVNYGDFTNNNAPEVSLDVPPDGVTNSTIHFTAVATDQDGDDLLYFWDLGDGNEYESSPTVSKNYSSSGTYGVSVTVSDMKGGTTRVEAEIVIYPIAPPEIVVEYLGVNIPDGDGSPSTEQGTDFGVADVAAGLARTFRIRNIGGGIKLYVDGSSSTDASFALSGLAPIVDTYDDFSIAFDPDSPGMKTAMIRIFTNDGDENPFHFVVRGEGILAPVPPVELVEIPAGSFVMGDSGNQGFPDELPQREVTFSKAFRMAKTEVSYAQFLAVFNWAYTEGLVDVLPTGGSSEEAVVVIPEASEVLMGVNDSSGNIAFADNRFYLEALIRMDEPAGGISWFGAVAFAHFKSLMDGLESCYDLGDWSCDFSKGGYRLPTEAEWEYAGRGGLTGKLYPWGDSIDASRANYENNQGGVSVSVESYEPNGYGLKNLAGNVWEWCWDWYGAYSGGPVVDPTGPGPGSEAKRVNRGGGFGSLALHCRVSMRGKQTPDHFGFSGLGFRIAQGAGSIASPEVAVDHQGTDIPSGDGPPSETKGTDFGYQEAGGGETERVFRVRNSGTAELVLGPPSSSSPDFSVEGLDSVVPPGGSTTFVVAFEPNAEGAIGSKIEFITNDSDENPFSFEVSGHGFVSPPVPNAVATYNAVVTDYDLDGVESVILDGSGSSDYSDVGIANWFWTWEGQNEPVSGEIVEVELPTGITEVTLTVTNGWDNSDTVLLDVKVNQPPVAVAEKIWFVSDPGIDGIYLIGYSSYDPDGEIVNAVWTLQGPTDFDGTLGTRTVSEDEFSPPAMAIFAGQTEVALTVTDDDGAKNTDSFVMWVDIPPAAEAVAMTNSPVTDYDGDGFETVILDGSGSFYSNAEPYLEEWRWSWDSVFQASGEVVQVELPVGMTEVTLEYVIYDVFTAAEDSHTVSVWVNVPPVARAGADREYVDYFDQGEVLVSLDGRESSDADGEIVSWDWSWDGLENPISGKLLEDIPMPVGETLVSLAVTDDKGGMNTDTVLIKVYPPTLPTAVATSNSPVTDNDGDGMETVILNGNGSTGGSGEIVSWLWSWDGLDTPVSGGIAEVGFPVGVTEVTLTVESIHGHSDTDTVTVQVEKKPIDESPGNGPVLSGDTFRPGEYAYVYIEFPLDGPSATNGLELTMPLPSGWEYVEDSGSVSSKPSEGATGEIAWNWQKAPAYPFGFFIKLAAPMEPAEFAILGGKAVYRDDSNEERERMVADIALQPVKTHSADLDGNWAMDGIELWKVIGLYQTLEGSIRTGVYRCDGESETGYADGPGNSLYCNGHSSDYLPRDWKIDLPEILRLIYLYNHREGSDRTGEYHVDPSQEDGFGKGPNPVQEDPASSVVSVVATNLSSDMRITSDDPFYEVDGGQITLRLPLVYEEALSSLGLEMDIPDGWSFVSDNTKADLKPWNGESTATLGWAWVDVGDLPESGFVMEVVLNYPSGMAGGITVVGRLFKDTVPFDYTAISLNKGYSLALAASPENGGTVDGIGLFEDGSNAVIHAFANEGFRFAGWLGGGIDDVASTATTVSMTEDRIVTAHFESVHRLQVYSGNGDVYIDPDEPFYSANDVVELTAVPLSGYAFEDWLVGDDRVEDNPLVLVIKKDTSVVARYRLSAGRKYADWIEAEDPGQQDLNLIGPERDLDFDGVPNLVEFVAGTAGKDGSPGGDDKPGVGAVGDSSYAFIFFADPANMRGELLAGVSKNLADWEEVGIYPEAGSWHSTNEALFTIGNQTEERVAGGIWKVVLVVADESYAGNNCFFRLKASAVDQ